MMCAFSKAAKMNLSFSKPRFEPRMPVTRHLSVVSKFLSTKFDSPFSATLAYRGEVGSIDLAKCPMPHSVIAQFSGEMLSTIAGKCSLKIFSLAVLVYP